MLSEPTEISCSSLLIEALYALLQRENIQVTLLENGASHPELVERLTALGMPPLSTPEHLSPSSERYEIDLTRINYLDDHLLGQSLPPSITFSSNYRPNFRPIAILSESPPSRLLKVLDALHVPYKTFRLEETLSEKNLAGRHLINLAQAPPAVQEYFCRED